MADLKSKIASVFRGLSDKIGPKKTSHSGGVVVEVDGSAMTYTQILTNKSGEDIVPTKQGANRDAARIGVISRTCGIFAVADGCGLTYWGEIAAHVAVHEFVSYMQQSMTNGISLEDLRAKLRAAIYHVNETLLSVKNSKTKKVVNVLDLGGNTTFVCGIIFPYIGSLKAVGGEIKLPDGWGAEEDDDFEEKWGLLCTGLGDSEVYCFRTEHAPKPQLVVHDTLGAVTIADNSGGPQFVAGGNKSPRKTPASTDDATMSPGVKTHDKLNATALPGSSNSSPGPKSTRHRGESSPVEDKSGTSTTDVSITATGAATTDSGSPRPKRLADNPKRSMSFDNSRTHKIQSSAPVPTIPKPKSSKKSDKEKSATLNLPLKGSKEHGKASTSPRTGDGVESPLSPSSNATATAATEDTANSDAAGQWFRVFSDNGKSPFLPYVGLKDKNIPEPVVLPLHAGDIVLACSDGVSASCKLEDFPIPTVETLQARDGVKAICRKLVETTIDCHKTNKTDPDDVTIAGIKLTSVPASKGSKPNHFSALTTEDLTAHFNAAFAASPSYKRDYLEEYLASYHK